MFGVFLSLVGYILGISIIPQFPPPPCFHHHHHHTRFFFSYTRYFLSSPDSHQPLFTRWMRKVCKSPRKEESKKTKLYNLSGIFFYYCEQENIFLAN